MSVALVLLGYAVALTAFAPLALSRATWPTRAPRLGVLAWGVLAWTAVSAVVLAGVSLVLGTDAVSAGVGDWLGVCAASLRRAYASPSSASTAGVGAALVLGVPGRLGWCAGRWAWSDTRARARLRAQVDLLGDRGIVPGVVVLDRAEPLAVCVSGDRGRVVLTSGAIDALAPDALLAVLAHERAHLRGRHHAVLGLFLVLQLAFPWAAFFRSAAASAARLLELAADDEAASRVGRHALRDALTALALHAPGTGLLAASAVAVRERIARLEAAAPLRHPPHVLLGSLTLLAAALPAVLLGSPIAAAALARVCRIA
ncbi:MAG: M56 family metallopeptidase [Motilibacteraceae bacterium]